MKIRSLVLPSSLLLAAAGLLACGEASADSDPGAGAGLVVGRGDLEQRVLLTGELVAEDSIGLITPNADVWPVQVRWLAEDGAEVAAGEVVVEFDNSQLAANLEELRAAVIQERNKLIGARAKVASEVAEASYAVEQARAAYQKAKLKADVPREILERIEYEQRQLEKARAEHELKNAELRLETRRRAGEAEIEIERIALDKARRALRRAEEGIELLSLRAPRDGILLRAQNPREGRPFQAGDTSYPGGVVARLPDLRSLIVQALLFDVDDGRVAPGQQARLTLDAYPQETFHGTVRSIEPMANAASRTSRRRGFRVVIVPETLDPARMRPGMSVKVEVAVPVAQDVLLVPRASIDWRARPPRVRLAGGGWATPELGACNATACAARGGLEAGTRLAPAAGGGR